jgi:hypothetical protein
LSDAEKTAARLARGDQGKVPDVDWRLYTLATDALKATGTWIDVACRNTRKLESSSGPPRCWKRYGVSCATTPNSSSAGSWPEIVEQMIQSSGILEADHRGELPLALANRVRLRRSLCRLRRRSSMAGGASSGKPVAMLF